MTALEQATLAVQQALGRFTHEARSRALLRHRLAAVTRLLELEDAASSEPALSGREAALTRERDLLLRRIGTLGLLVSDSPDVAGVRESVGRLVADLEHHQQRLNDLVYDSVALDLGGSE